MRPNRIRTWREFVDEFLRSGPFSLRPVPKTEAERELEAKAEVFPG